MAAESKVVDTIDAAIQFINKQPARPRYDAKYDKSKPNALPCSPSAERNKGPIFEKLKQYLPQKGIVLEIGSYYGQHCVYFAEQIRSSNLKASIKCKWQPTDYIDECFEAIQQRVNQSKVDINSFILKPKILNLLDNEWESKYAQNDDIQLVYVSNVTHISDWQCSISLFRGASAVLCKGGKLCIYGPFLINDCKHEKANKSNMRFSLSLKSRNKSWGVRNLEDFTKYCNKYGLILTRIIDMPANNYLLIHEKV